MPRSLLACAWLLVAAGGRPVAAQPHHSFDKMVSANGYGAITYDLARRRLDGFYEHLYRYPTSDTAATETRDFLYDAYFGIRVGTEATWLTEVPIDGLGYGVPSGVIDVVQHWRGLDIELFAFAPWDHPGPALVMTILVTNRGSSASAPVSLFSIHNVHAGGGRPETAANGERIVWAATHGSYAETGPGGAVFVYRPLGGATRHGCSPNSPYDAVRAAADLVDTDDSGVRDDAVAGFQLDIGPLAPGASVDWGVAIGFDAGGDAAAARARIGDYVAGRGAQDLVEAEYDLWSAWMAEPPSGLAGPDEADVWRQSQVVLRMAQVREAGRGHGQIVASLPPGQWNIAWVRDMCYAVVGLVHTRHYAEARAALEFMLGAEVGDYESYVGRPYRISVTRYFGDGSEESDWNENGPNIEFDGFGLFLWALGEYAEASADAFWNSHWPAIRDGIADVLVSLIDPATGLIAPDSSIWEVHWNGRQKRYAYTSLAAARGLCAASRLARSIGEADKADEYLAAALALRDAIVTRLTDDDLALAQSLEELTAGSGYRDAAVVEAFNWGLVRPDGAIGNATLDSFLTHLRPPSGRGFFRNDDGGWYDNQEWVFIDLRAANAFRLAGRRGIADDLIAWVAAQAALNQNLIAELHDATTSDYAGAVPMVGFGAGAYVTALRERGVEAGAEPCCGEWPAEPGADGDGDAGTADGDGSDVSGEAGGGEPGSDGGGCACAAASGDRAAWTVLVVLAASCAMASGRRRRR